MYDLQNTSNSCVKALLRIFPLWFLKLNGNYPLSLIHENSKMGLVIRIITIKLQHYFIYSFKEHLFYFPATSCLRHLSEIIEKLIQIQKYLAKAIIKECKLCTDFHRGNKMKSAVRIHYFGKAKSCQNRSDFGVWKFNREELSKYVMVYNSADLHHFPISIAQAGSFFAAGSKWAVWYRKRRSFKQVCRTLWSLDPHPQSWCEKLAVS